jgi:uncharacterized protein YcgL (UPF0745 family)
MQRKFIQICQRGVRKSQLIAQPTTLAEKRKPLNSNTMQCWIYKGSRRAETYLYLRDEDGISLVPDALIEAMGKLEFVMQLSLSHERELARASTQSVMRELEQRGYYLQMPPAKDAQPAWVQ